MKVGKLILVAIVLVPAIWSCSTSSGGGSADASSDVTTDGDGAHQIVDLGGSSDVDVASPEDSSDDAVADVTPQPTNRLVSFKAIGGASMGANGLRIHSQHPDRFDMSAALGGYINPTYLHGMLRRLWLGGSCEFQTLLDNLDDLDNPGAPALQCGPGPSVSPWEFPTDFTHWKADHSGGSFTRGVIFSALENICMAEGNLLSYNPEHPLLPPGVPVSWLAPGKGAENCAAPVVVGKPDNYNAEYNPSGDHNLVTFCDGTPPVEGAKDDPEYLALAGNYDPNHAYDTPISFVLVVDINGNGRRDFHEPAVINSMERFEDVGADGCLDGEEDGDGGCTGGGSGHDPNGDNYGVPDNALGTQGDGYRQDGEFYQDFGLDGVDGTGDFGEGDGAHSMNPNLVAAIEASALHWISTAPMEQLDRVTLALDGGVRDSMHALVSTWPMAARLVARGASVGFFTNYTGEPGALHPSGEVVDLTSEAGNMDLSSERIGDHYIVAYGSMESSPDEIAAGDGKHVGTMVQAVNRLTGFVLTALYRWPDLHWEACPGHFGKVGYSTFYSPALQNRFAYAYSLPPCYDMETTKDLDFPLIAFLPGQGTDAMANAGSGVVFNLLAMMGTIPKFIMLAPEWNCCLMDFEGGGRYCACQDNEEDGSLFDCVDPTCEGPHEACDVLQVPRDSLVEECNQGHFFARFRCDQFGNTEHADRMDYESMMLEMIEHFEGRFKVRPPREYPPGQL
jgi:hypothetical protein